MKIAGGLYLELCETPEWNRILGSGGRAALAVSSLSKSVKLHTYIGQNIAPRLGEFYKYNVEVIGIESTSAIAFSYFHPLSVPLVTPPIAEIPKNVPIQIAGEVVLRFGFIEGDAIVDAKKAIYDPQTHIDAPLFHTNGSKAERLALVMNEHEIKAMGQNQILDEAAKTVMNKQRAEVVVAKGGPFGASIYTSNKKSMIPSYQSSKVFKIGTGDIFSAMFSHYWGELDMPPHDAADWASRAVAYYCEHNGDIPIPAKAGNKLMPNAPVINPKILLIGSMDTIGGRWSIDELSWCLKQLGAEITLVNVNEATSNANTYTTALNGCSAILIALDSIAPNVLSFVTELECGLPTIIFSERATSMNILPRISNLILAPDITTSVYRAFWAANKIEKI